MKTQIILVLTLVASLMSACDDTDPGPTTIPMPVPTTEPVIRSVYPSAGAPGSTVAIFGENFGPTSSQNYVTFESVSAEIAYVGYGVINVLVPNLADGDYAINVNVEGQLAGTRYVFTVTDSPY
jgi:IPT/TIG domain